MALTWKGVPFMWGDEQQTAFDALKACLLSAPILGFPTEKGDKRLMDSSGHIDTLFRAIARSTKLGQKAHWTRI